MQVLFINFFYVPENGQNWFGIDDTLGPIAVSILRERVTQQHHLLLHDALSRHSGSSNLSSIESGGGGGGGGVGTDQYLYRLMIRTSDLLPLRGCVLEDSIPALKSEKIKTIPTKEVLEFVCPEINPSK